MRRTLLRMILASLLCAAPVAAEEEAPMLARNHLFFELLGNGGVYSINYERFLTDRWALRLGFADWDAEGFWSDSEKNYLMVPVTSSLLFGHGSNFLEVGAGLVWGRVTKDYDNNSQPRERQTITNLTGILGYRHQPPAGGFVFRIAFTPFYSLNDEDGWPEDDFTPSFGVSWGGAF